MNCVNVIKWERIVPMLPLSACLILLSSPAQAADNFKPSLKSVQQNAVEKPLSKSQMPKSQTMAMVLATGLMNAHGPVEYHPSATPQKFVRVDRGHGVAFNDNQIAYAGNLPTMMPKP